jgi:hypothetical protein
MEGAGQASGTNGWGAFSSPSTLVRTLLFPLPHAPALLPTIQNIIPKVSYPTLTACPSFILTYIHSSKMYFIHPTTIVLYHWCTLHYAIDGHCPGPWPVVSPCFSLGAWLGKCVVVNRGMTWDSIVQFLSWLPSSAPSSVVMNISQLIAQTWGTQTCSKPMNYELTEVGPAWVT